MLLVMVDVFEYTKYIRGVWLIQNEVVLLLYCVELQTEDFQRHLKEKTFI